MPSGNIFYGDGSGLDIRILFFVFIRLVFVVEVGKYIYRRIFFVDPLVIDFQAVNFNVFGHITGITEVVAAGVDSADKLHRSRFWRRHPGELTVADNDFTMPETSVVSPQIDKKFGFDRSIFPQQSPVAGHAYALMAQSAVFYGGIIYAHVGIDSGKSAVVEYQIFTVV